MKHLFLSATDGCYRTEHLLSLYVDGQLSGKLVHEVDNHLAECSSCKAALVIMQATRQVLMNRETVQPPAYLSERLRQTIAIEATRPLPAKLPATWIGHRIAFAGAGIAAAAVFAFVALHHSSPTALSTPGAPKPIAVAIDNGLAHAHLPMETMPQVRKISTLPIKTHNAEFALLPRSEEFTPSAIRLSIPSSPHPLQHELPPAPAVTTSHRSTSFTTTAPAKNSGEGTSVIASLPPSPPVVIPHTSVIPTAPSVTITNPAPPAPVTVADNTGEMPVVGPNARLRTLALDTQVSQSSSIQPSNVEVRLASDSQGMLPIVGSEIH